MEYWTIIDNQHAGPFTAEQLADMGVTPDTLIWHEGLTDWVKAREVREIATIMIAREEAARRAQQPAGPAPAENGGRLHATPEEIHQNPGDYGYVNAGAPQPGNASYAAANGQRYAEPQPYDPENPEGIAEDCPPSYLVWSIICVLLCVPTAIAAIIMSAQVKQSYRRGDLARAKKMSEWAQWMIILSITLGVIYLPFSLAFSSFAVQ